VKRKGVLFGLGGGLVVLGSLAIWVVCLPPTEAQDLPQRSRDSSINPLGPLTPPAPPSSQVGIGTDTPHSDLSGITPKSSLQDQLKGESIDQLLVRLDAIKVQKAELEKAEKETVEALKDKLSQQNQRLQELGVNVEKSSPVLTTPGLLPAGLKQPKNP
jgi:hypothetical protein